MADNVKSYELDREVFSELERGKDTENLKKWQGVASNIASYVSTWGVERFWAMSRSLRLIGGVIPEFNDIGSDEAKRYFAWAVARIVLCNIVGNDLGINADMTTKEFQERYQKLNFNQQTLLIELLLQIADTIQFWTMRIKDANGQDV